MKIGKKQFVYGVIKNKIELETTANSVLKIT
jgi:hypothetical protein